MSTQNNTIYSLVFEDSISILRIHRISPCYSCTLTDLLKVKGKGKSSGQAFLADPAAGPPDAMAGKKNSGRKERLECAGQNLMLRRAGNNDVT